MTLASEKGYGSWLIAWGIVGGLLCASAGADVSLLGTQYQPDATLSEFQCFWKDSNYPTSCGVPLPGANVKVFIKNTGGSAVTLDDINFASYNLKTILKMKDNNGHVAWSIHYYWADPPQAIFDAGEPAWYKMDPPSIPAGGVGQVVVRLRRVPTVGSLAVNVDTSANILNTTVTVDPDAAQCANISFSTDLKQIYVYWRRAGGAAPTTVKMNGNDVTSSTVTVGDASTNYAVSVVSLETALTEGTFQVFQGVYSDGATATGGVRIFVNPFTYTTWAALGTSDNAEAQVWINTANDRGINTLEMNGASAGLMSYLGSTAGRNYADSKDYGFIKDDQNWGTWSNNPRMWFIDDEPDIEEANMLNNFCGTGYKLPCGSNQAGVMGITFVNRANELRAMKNRPTTINLDGTWKPYSYFAYGQLSDCLAIDHYMQPKTRHVYYDATHRRPLYDNAMVIYATARAGSLAAEPNPSRQLLYSCSLNKNEPVDPWPWADPECKRVEAYYAMAGGAKGLGYWWFKYAPSASNGLDNGQENVGVQDVPLYNEIGLIGAEIKTLAPYLVTSHPVDLDLEGNSAYVWAKGLARGTDTLILFVVNDDYWLDQDYHNTPVANATLTVGLPSWMLSSPTAFEFSRAGLSNISSSLSGNDLTLTLGTLNVAKIIMVTTDPYLRMTIQQRYDTISWPGICNFASSVCNQINTAPSFVQHPTAQTALAGGSAKFSMVVTGGSQLTYRWQKNGTNINDGGHYSGATTPFLTISSIDTNDVANYRCKVTNPHGTATSNAAGLTISTVNITSHPSSQAVCTGGTAQFSVTATGQGTLYYQWQKNGANISNGGHYSGCTTATLTISSADTNDVADYRCKVTDNTSSLFSNVAPLVIKAETAITAQPADQGIEVGGTAVFTVTAAGYGILTYQWQKNSVNLDNGGHYSGCTTATLTVTPADTNDVANYRCVVSGGCGTVISNQATLSIDLCAPVIGLDNGAFDDSTSAWTVAENWTSYSNGSASFAKNTNIYYSAPNAQRVTPPGSGNPSYCGVYQNVNAGTGDAITVVARSYNESPSTYITSQLGLQLNGSTTRPGSWTTNSTKQSWTQLTAAGNATSDNGVTIFLEATRGSTGTYHADFDNVVEYRAVVPPAPTVTVVSSTSLSVNVDPGCNAYNNNAEFAITIGGGAYTLGTHWVQANGTVSTTQVWQTDANWGTKTVTGLSTGVTYTFQVKCRYNSTYSQNSSLGAGAQGVPQSTLVISQHPTAQSICPGASAQFSVVASGQGTLTYQWQKNSVNLSNGGHYSGCTTATLTVSNADTNDAANYRCLVVDAYGSLYSNQAALTIRAATTITGQPAAQNVCPGEDTEFTVTATGYGTLSYQWQKNSVNLNNGGHYSGCTTATLYITGPDTNDAANYRCVVTGGCGNATSNQAALTIKAYTNITGQPSNQSISAGGNTNFTVSATGEGSLTYQWQKDGADLSNGGHYSGVTTATMTVSNADTNDEGLYRCIVTAGCGSDISEEATLTIIACSTPTLTNGMFEASTAANPPSGWTTYIQSSKSGNWTIQTVTPPEGTQWQQTQVFNVSSWGGVRQNITGLTGGHIYTISGSYKTNSISATATVRYNLSGDTNRTNSTVLATTSSSNWVTFSGNVTASGTSLMLFLDHLNGTSSNKAGAFDNLKIICAP